MKKTPVLDEIRHEKSNYLLRVHGGLHMIKANGRPYFTVTADLFERGLMQACGCLHEEIEEQFPGKYTDLIGLHLSDIDGIPGHAAENAWYWLAGAIPGHFNVSYHGGNGTPKRSENDCLEIFAKHLRISFAEAVIILEQVRAKAMAARHSRIDVAREELTRIVEGMKPRWKREADACIERHKLNVFGDDYRKVP